MSSLDRLEQLLKDCARQINKGTPEGIMPRFEACCQKIDLSKRINAELAHIRKKKDEKS